MQLSQVVSLLGQTNREVLSGINTGLLGLYLSGVPAQIPPRLIASESCYPLTAWPRSSHAHTRAQTSVGRGEASLQEMLTLAWLTPQGGQRSPNNPQSHRLTLLRVPKTRERPPAANG